MHHHHHHRGGTTITLGGSAAAIVNIVVMLFVGLLLLGMGAVFVVIAQSSPLLHDGFLLTGGMLALAGLIMFGIGIVMWRKRASAQQLNAAGVPGQAVLLGMTQTSFHVNDQPVMELQLQVTTAMSAPYLVRHRETLPPTAIGRLAAGQVLPVMVDPARPDNIVITWG